MDGMPKSVVLIQRGPKHPPPPTFAGVCLADEIEHARGGGLGGEQVLLVQVEELLEHDGRPRRQHCAQQRPVILCRAGGLGGGGGGVFGGVSQGLGWNSEMLGTGRQDQRLARSS